MAVLDLIQEARIAGLEIRLDGSELVIRGPRRLAHLARQLIDRKADVLLALTPSDISAVLPLVDTERAAIQWVENGPAADVDAALNHAIRGWAELCGVSVNRDVPRVDVSSLKSATPAPARRLRQVGRRLTGNGFPPIPPTIPPPEILATPRTICPCCGVQPVLPELRGLAAGRCWDCWATSETDKRFRS